MKKIISVLLVIIFVIFLSSCNKQQDRKDEIFTSNSVRYGYDEFLTLCTQNSDALENSINSAQSRSFSNWIIPLLKSDDFYCTNVYINNNELMLEYNPTYISKDRPYSSGEGISIAVLQEEASFYTYKENFLSENFLIEYISDEYAYYSSANMWFINDNGRCIIIYFPDNIKFSDPERISDYFEFEVLNPSNNNTVTE